MQFEHSLFDLLESTNQEVFAGGITETDAVVITKSGAHHSSHTGLVEEIHRHIGTVVDGVLAVTLAIVCRHFGEEIEGTLGHTDLDVGNVAEHLVHHIATFAEGFTHLGDILVCLGIHHHGCNGSLLGNGAGGRGELTLQLVAGFGDRQRSGDETNTPTCHGEALGHTVDGDDTVADTLELGDALVTTHKVDVLVDFVGHHIDMRIAFQHASQSFEFLFAVEHTRGVAGSAEHKELGLGGDGSLELCGGNLEFVLDACLDELADTTRVANHLAVGNPVGSRDDDLVARIDKALNQLEDALLGTRGDNDLLGFELEIVVAFELIADSLTQVGITRNGRIVGEVLVDGLLGGFLGLVGGVEVGFADRKAYDVLALSFQFACLSLSPMLKILLDSISIRYFLNNL